MQDPPSASVIAGLARSSEAGSKFEDRLVAAAVQLVERAAALAPASDKAETERLSALLGESGELEQLNRRLCKMISDGAMTLSSSGLAAHLRATAMEKLAIDQPSYAAYRRALNEL